MRIDKFLKVSRIIKRRTVKASYDVKVGDVITVSFGQRELTVRVTNVLEHALKADASTMYEVVEQNSK